MTITVEERKQALASADSVFQAIAVAAPDSYLGNFWRARANSALDPETTLGLAKPFYEEVATLLKVKMILVTMLPWLSATAIWAIIICWLSRIRH